MPPFAHLHLHTQFSLLDGANQIEPLLTHVARLNQSAVAITDHGNLFGAIEFYSKATAAGVKPIIGCEVYMAPGSRLVKDRTLPQNDYYHLILLAQNETGYRNLIKLVSQGYLDGFYYKPRIDKALLRQHADGLIALSGCLTGEIPYLLGEGNTAGAAAVAQEFREIFGPDQFYLELQANGLEEQLITNRGLVDLHRQLGVPLVATNDCHYLTAADAHPHELLLCLQTGTTIHDPNRFRFNTNQLYVKSSEEMAQAFHELPEAIANTVRIADACALTLTFNRTFLPQYTVPAGKAKEQYLEELALAGLKQRLAERPSTISTATYDLRLREELLTICTMGFAGYFLIVWDIIRFARSRKIPVGPGRGSAAGSLVAYALRITDLDPLHYTLLFERFLNPDRVSLPDIDMDFCMDRRQEVINYVIEKYGADHVAQIITFGTLGAKAALRDVGRVLEIPLSDVNRLAKLVPAQLNITLDTALAQEAHLREQVDQTPQFQDLFRAAKSLEGLARHASTHAAGLVISDAPLTDHVPLYTGSDGEVVTQFPMGDVEKIGLVKFDFLGLKTLTMIRQAEALIHETHPEAAPFAIDHVPLDDPATFTLLSSGKTMGLFQLESTGMRDLLTRLRPDTFEDLIAILALYRPGPMDLIPDFIGRKQGRIPITYDWPTLEPILKSTYGVIVYQEQVMAIAHQVAGFSLGQADILRRAMGKKKPEEMEKLRKKFIDGCCHNQVPPTLADALFTLIEKFAGYGFNKSHAAAYALISYQTAYLKTHYPTEFMAAFMTCEIGNPDKIMLSFSECRSLHIPILPPDINVSQRHFTVVDKQIRFGLAAIKNVGEAAVEAILAGRRSGPYRSLFDFCGRIDHGKLNKRALEGFIKVGAFDSTGGTRAQLMAVLDDAIKHGQQQHKQRSLGQISIFGEDHEPSAASQTVSLPVLDDWDPSIRLQYERELTGFYISAHPLQRFQDELSLLATATISSLPDLPEKQLITLCGTVGSLKPITTKKGDTMGILTLEDLTGSVEVVIFPDLFLLAKSLLGQDHLVRVTGVLETSEKGPKILGSEVEDLPAIYQQLRQHLKLTIPLDTTSRESLQTLHQVLMTHPGESHVSLRFILPQGWETCTMILPTIRIDPSPPCLAQIRALIGESNIAYAPIPPRIVSHSKTGAIAHVTSIQQSA